MKSVSIILPVHNGEKYLKNLKKSISEQEYNGYVEIIAPISKSKDNSYNLAKELFDNVYRVENFNHGLTRHEAAKKAQGDILIFITQDMVLV